MKYFAKPDTWFVEGTEVELIGDMRPFMDAAIFCGIRHRDGETFIDEEVSPFDDFEEFEDDSIH